MSTGYRLLKDAFSNLRIESNSEHTHIDLFDRQSVHIGRLIVRTTSEHGQEDMETLLRSFFKSNIGFTRVGIGNGQTKLFVLAPLRWELEEYQGKVVLSDYGEVVPTPSLPEFSTSKEQ